MSIEISQESFKGQEVELKIDIPDTSILRDHSSECYLLEGCTLLRSLPFTLVLNGKTIEGDFCIHREHTNDDDAHDVIEVGVAFYKDKMDKCYSIKAKLEIINLETEKKTIKEFKDQFAEFDFNDRYLDTIKSARYGKSLNMKNDSYHVETCYISYNAVSSSHLSIKGIIILDLHSDFVKTLKEDSVPTSMLENFKSLICKNAFAQVDNNFKIICQGEEFQFNKTLLSMVSEVFAKMVQGNFNKEATSNSVEIIDFSPDTIRTFQKFAFENEEIKDEEMNMELLMFAQKYLMKPLIAKCRERLFANITHGNVFEIIKTAYFIDDEDIFKEASEYLKANSEELKDTDDWLSFEEANPKIIAKVYRFMMFDSNPKGKGKKNKNRK